MSAKSCRHGVRITEAWWECGDCVRENGFSREEVNKLRQEHDKLKRQIRQNKNRVHEKTPEENQRALRLQIAAVFWGGFWISLLIGIAGCSVRSIGFGQRNPFQAFVVEALITYVLVLIWGIRDAFKTFGRK